MVEAASPAPAMAMVWAADSSGCDNIPLGDPGRACGQPAVEAASPEPAMAMVWAADNSTGFWAIDPTSLAEPTGKLSLQNLACGDHCDEVARIRVVRTMGIGAAAETQQRMLYTNKKCKTEGCLCDARHGIASLTCHPSCSVHAPCNDIAHHRLETFNEREQRCIREDCPCESRRGNPHCCITCRDIGACREAYHSPGEYSYAVQMGHPSQSLSMSNMGAGLTHCDLLDDDSDDDNELGDDSSETRSLHPGPTLHLQTPGGGGGQGDGYDDRRDDSKDSDDDLGDKGDDNDKLDHDSTRGHPGEGPANGEYAGKLMTWSAYVLDPRTKSVPPVGEPIPDDASIEQLRCHTRGPSMQVLNS